MKATRDLEEKASANQASALELLRMGEQLQQTVENMKTVRSDDVHFAPHITCISSPTSAFVRLWLCVRAKSPSVCLSSCPLCIPLCALNPIVER